MSRLTGKVALVTGAARGLGRAIAEAFSIDGAQVVIADIDDDVGHAAAQAIGRGGARFVHLDVSDPRSWANAVADTERTFGRLDILVNNAGIIHHASLADTTLDDYERVVAVNQVGPFLGMQAVVRPMRDAGGGSIVNVSSVRGLSGADGLMAYVATKFAVRGMTKVAALELGQHNIRVNSLHPGALATPSALGDDISDLTIVDSRFADQPIPHIGRPEEVARLALFLASDDSSYCTGAEFVADGGATAGPRRRRMHNV